MKKWMIAVLAMAILAAGAVSVSAAVDNTQQPLSNQCTVLAEKAALQACDGIPDRDGTGNQYQGVGADMTVSVDTAETDTTPNNDDVA